MRDDPLPSTLTEDAWLRRRERRVGDDGRFSLLPAKANAATRRDPPMAPWWLDVDMKQLRDETHKSLPMLHQNDDEYYCNGKNKRHCTTYQRIISVMTYWFVLGGLSMIARFIAIYQSPYRLRDILYLPFILGIMQDVAIISQALAVMWCVKMLFGESLWILPTLAMVFCNMAPFLDIMLQLQNCPRIELELVVYLCDNFNIFYGSLKQAAESSWISVGLFMMWCAFILFGASCLNYVGNVGITKRKDQIILFSRKRMTVIFATNYVCIMLAMRILTYEKVDQSVMYCVANPIFKLQHEALGNTDAAPNMRAQLTSNAVENVTSASELYTMPALDLSDLLGNASYPTLRNTIEYQGPKLFNIDIKEDPNILLIMMESWKDLRYLGNDARKKITPEFNKLCSTGIHFDAHYTPSVQTSRSIMSNLFGNLPEMLLVPAIKEYPALNLKGLPTLTKAKGYHNAFISAVDLGWDNWSKQLKRFGFDQLEDWKSLNKLLRDRNYPPVEKEHEGNWGLWDEKAFDGLYEHMKDMNAKGVKSFINFYTISTHWPYQIPNSYVIPEEIDQFAHSGEDYKYLATLSYSDRQLGRFIAKCRKTGLLNNTIVFIQGDHGGPSPAHVTNGVRDDVTHLPALLLADGLIPHDQIGKSFSQVSSQVDVFATMADIIGIPEGGMSNHGIGSSMIRYDPNKVVYLENPFEGKTIGCRIGNMKVVQDGSALLKVYNMSTDPLEEHPLSSYDAAKTADLIEMTKRVVNMYSALYGLNQFSPPK